MSPGERWSVILAGGVGSRFWPLSTPERPKQLLPLVDDRPMLANSLDRLAPLTPPERTLVLTNASLVKPILAAVPGLPRENIVAEPRPAGTAAALAYAAAEIRRRAGDDAVMLSVHADWAIGDTAGFRAALEAAAEVAEREHGLVTVGIVPSRPDPGFGYIEPGEAAEATRAMVAPRTADGAGDVRMGGDATHARHVARFVEKPSRERAAEMCATGYLWNSGIFVWRVGDFLDEVRALTPEVAPALEMLNGTPGQLERFFAVVQSVSVDVGVLERSRRVYVIPGDFGWDDVGTWGALRRVREPGRDGNVVSGPAHLADAHGNVVHAEGNAVVLYGVSDLVVVTRNGLTFVTTVDKSTDLKTLVDTLPDDFKALA